MLLPRVIPCLLLHKGGLYKTVQFKNPRYVGDPINTVKIFNEKEVDEIMIVDIDATIEGREPRYEQIEDIVSEAFMPVSYGGGVKSTDQMRRLFSLGVEKVFVSSAAIENPDLISEGAALFGNQAIGVTLDVKKGRWGKKRIVVTHNAKKKANVDLLAMAQKAEQLGAGELTINDVDRDGTMTGYDLDLFRDVSSKVGIPLIALGGARDLEDIKRVIFEGGASAAAAGSLFVFTGVHRAVLITYPSQDELMKLLGV